MANQRPKYNSGLRLRPRRVPISKLSTILTQSLIETNFQVRSPLDTEVSGLEWRSVELVSIRGQQYRTPLETEFHGLKWRPAQFGLNQRPIVLVSNRDQSGPDSNGVQNFLISKVGRRQRPTLDFWSPNLNCYQAFGDQAFSISMPSQNLFGDENLDF